MRHDNAGAVDILWNGAGIEDGSEQEKFIELYPNPASEKIEIQFTAKQAGEVKIEVISVAGNKVKEVKTDFTLSDNRIEINLADIPGGVYFLRVTSSKGSYSKKFVVAK